MSLRHILVHSRPRFWLYLAGPVLVGAVFGAGSVDDLLAPVPIALLAYFLLPANIFLYGINDIFDATIDRANPKKDDREARYRGDDHLASAVVLSAILGLALVAVIPLEAAPWLVGFLILGAAYSAPPMRFKTRPPLDSISNGLYVLPGVVAYVALAGAVPPAITVLGGWSWAMAMHTFSAIPDIEPDRLAGIETTATRLGARLALAYCGAMWLLATVLFALVHPWFGLLFSIYPILSIAIALSDVAIARAYWWYPTVNSIAGMVFTLGGIWRLVHG